MQTSGTYSRGASSGMKAGRFGKSNKIDRQQRRLQQRGGARLAINQHPGKPGGRYA